MSKIKEIAEMRRRRAVMRGQVEAQEKTLEGISEYQNLERTKNILTRLEFDLRQEELRYKVECVAAYKETGEKNQPGGQVKQFALLEYDKEQARLWAIEHNHAGLLNLAKREFERVAKSLNPDFVTITQVSRMTLSKDLNEFLED